MFIIPFLFFYKNHLSQMYDSINFVGFHIVDLQTNGIIHDLFHSTSHLKIHEVDACSYKLTLFQSCILFFDLTSSFVYSNDSVIFRFFAIINKAFTFSYESSGTNVQKFEQRVYTCSHELGKAKLLSEHMEQLTFQLAQWEFLPFHTLVILHSYSY